MRIKAITPIRVSEAELARRQARYEALSPPGVEVELVNLPGRHGVPDRLNSARDIRALEEIVIEEASRTDPARHDAVLPDCVLDPGLDRLERECPVQAFGILKLSSGFLVSLGHRFGAFTRNRPIGEELRDRLEPTVSCRTSTAWRFSTSPSRTSPTKKVGTRPSASPRDGFPARLPRR